MTQPTREDCWNRQVVPQDTKFGRWFDQRRCAACGRQSLQRLCLECGEQVAEQQVKS